MAKFFTGAGVASMAAPPTATTGEPCGPVNPATSCADAQRDERGDQARGHAQGAHPAGRGAGGAGG